MTPEITEQDAAMLREIDNLAKRNQTQNAKRDRSTSIANLVARPSTAGPASVPPATNRESDLRREALEAIQAEHLEEQRKRRIEAMISQFEWSGTPARHAEAMVGIQEGPLGLLKEIECPPWRQRTQRLLNAVAKPTGAIFALLGPRGTGKTQAACLAVQQSIRLGNNAKYTTAQLLPSKIRETFSSKKSERAVRMEFEDPALLVIDAYEEHGDSKFEDRLLVDIIDTRYRENRDTIIISNLTPGEFGTSAGASIVDRMREGGAVFEFNEWPSFRAMRGSCPEKLKPGKPFEIQGAE